MNLLEVVPALDSIIGKIIQDPNQAGNLKLELEKLDVQKDIERYKVQQSWLSNKSVYVAGAIPTILWLLSVVVAFNHIIAPLLMGMGMNLPILELPSYYTDLAGTIVLGLFAKKAWDDSTIEKFGKKPKEEKAVEVKVVEKVKVPVVDESGEEPVSEIPKDDPDYYNKRYEELIKKFNKTKA